MGHPSAGVHTVGGHTLSKAYARRNIIENIIKRTKKSEYFNLYLQPEKAGDCNCRAGCIEISGMGVEI